MYIKFINLANIENYVTRIVTGWSLLRSLVIALISMKYAIWMWGFDGDE